MPKSSIPILLYLMAIIVGISWPPVSSFPQSDVSAHQQAGTPSSADSIIAAYQDNVRRHEQLLSRLILESKILEEQTQVLARQVDSLAHKAGKRRHSWLYRLTHKK
jgi:hypothetical protein